MNQQEEAASVIIRSTLKNQQLDQSNYPYYWRRYQDNHHHDESIKAVQAEIITTGQEIYAQRMRDVQRQARRRLPAWAAILLLGIFIGLSLATAFFLNCASQIEKGDQGVTASRTAHRLGER